MTPRKPVEEHKRWQAKQPTPEQLEYLDKIRRKCHLDPCHIDQFLTELYGEEKRLEDLDRGGVSSLLERISCWHELHERPLKLRGQTSLPF